MEEKGEHKTENESHQARTDFRWYGRIHHKIIETLLTK